jgi:hypothetical protein
MARGICQYACHNATGTWTSSKSFGLCTGAKLASDPAAEHVQGLGNDDEILGGLAKPEFSIDFLPCDADLINLALRAATGYPCSALTEFYAKIGAGYDYVFAGCRIDKLALSGAVGKPLSAKADVKGVSRTQSALAKPSGIAARRRPFLWYKSTVCTIGGASYRCEGWDITVNNHVAPDTDLDGAATGAQRLPKRNEEGDELVTLDVTLKTELPESVTATYGDDLLTNIAFQTTLKSAFPDTIGFAIAGMAQFKGDIGAEPGGKVQTFKYSFETRLNSNALTVTYTPGS